MKDKRMPKGWVLVGTSDLSYGENHDRHEIFKREQKFRNVNRNIPRRSVEEMEKEAVEAYIANEAYKEQLLDAFNEKRLKSKNLIKQAKSFKRKRSKAAAAQ